MIVDDYLFAIIIAGIGLTVAYLRAGLKAAEQEKLSV
jgi:hypothetical protein